MNHPKKRLRLTDGQTLLSWIRNQVDNDPVMRQSELNYYHRFGEWPQRRGRRRRS